MHQRGGKRMSLSHKKKAIVRHRSPAVGERRAIRKRIILSNNNALRVADQPRMDGDNLAAQESAGRVFKVPEDAIDQLRKVEAFKSSQTWNLFHSPHMLVRPETVEVCARMTEAAGKGETARIIVGGREGRGQEYGAVAGHDTCFLEQLGGDQHS